MALLVLARSVLVRVARRQRRACSRPAARPRVPLGLLQPPWLLARRELPPPLLRLRRPPSLRPPPLLLQPRLLLHATSRMSASMRGALKRERLTFRLGRSPRRAVRRLLLLLSRLPSLALHTSLLLRPPLRNGFLLAPCLLLRLQLPREPRLICDRTIISRSASRATATAPASHDSPSAFCLASSCSLSRSLRSSSSRILLCTLRSSSSRALRSASIASRLAARISPSPSAIGRAFAAGGAGAEAEAGSPSAFASSTTASRTCGASAAFSFCASAATALLMMACLDSISVSRCESLAGLGLATSDGALRSAGRSPSSSDRSAVCSACAATGEGFSNSSSELERL